MDFHCLSVSVYISINFIYAKKDLFIIKINRSFLKHLVYDKEIFCMNLIIAI